MGSTPVPRLNNRDYGYISEASKASYRKARKIMLNAIALPSDFIPKEPDFTLEQSLDENWLPR